MKKLKVMHILISVGVGGVMSLVRDIVIGHNKEEIEPIILSLAPRSYHSFNRKTLEDHGISIIELDKEYHGIHLMFKIYRAIKRIKPDIVHSHINFVSYYSMLPTILNRVPVRVRTIHNDSLFNSYCLGQRLKGGLIFKIFKHLPRVKSHRIRKLTKAIKKNGEPIGYHRVVVNRNSILINDLGDTIDENSIDEACIGAALMEIMYRKFNFKANAVSKSVRKSFESVFNIKGIPVIYNGIEIEKYKNIPKQRNREIMNIIFVGRFAKQKNLELLIDAFELVLKEHNNVKLILVGDGPTKFHIMREVVEMKIADHVEFLEFREDIPALLAGSDIFVLPSIHEGLGIVLLEAMASALPIVTCSISGVSEVVQDEVNGIMVKPDDPQAFATALIRLIQNRKLREKIGANGLKMAERFDIKAVREKYEKLYRHWYNSGKI